MQEYIFYLPYFKSTGKTIAVTNENGENVGQLKRMHKNMWTKSIDFLTRDGLPVLDSIS
ncbi:tubby C-terminal domain-like protein [Priestia megaterium]